MNADTITQWLQSPGALPQNADMNAALHDWPWFIPVRMMEAVRGHQQELYSAKTLLRLQVWGSNWVPAYNLLQDAEHISSIEVFVPPRPVDYQMPVADKVPEQVDIDSQTVQDAAPVIQPLYVEDYFRHLVVEPVEETSPAKLATSDQEGAPNTLMVMMSFAEWLAHFKTKSEKELQEEHDKRALRSMWQQEKLASVLEDEPEEIPEDVFEMAVSSITREEGLATESLAEILEKQEKWSAAADMYRRLAVKNPAKSAYFASRAEAAKKRLL